jgi:hypothetical protein
LRKWQTVMPSVAKTMSAKSSIDPADRSLGNVVSLIRSSMSVLVLSYIKSKQFS